MNKPKADQRKSNCLYVLVDKDGRDFVIDPSETAILSTVKNYLAAYIEKFRYGKPRLSPKDTEELEKSLNNMSVNDAVSFFNAQFDSNEQLKNAVIDLYNKTMIPLSKSSFVGVKLVSKPTVNFYDLPVYKQNIDGSKTQIYLPIVYKSDLDNLLHDFDKEIGNSKLREGYHLTLLSILNPCMTSLYGLKTKNDVHNYNKEYIQLFNDQYSYVLDKIHKLIKFSTNYMKGYKTLSGVTAFNVITAKDKDDIDSIILTTQAKLVVNTNDEKILKVAENSEFAFDYFTYGGNDYLFTRTILCLLVLFKKVWDSSKGSISIKDVASNKELFLRFLIFSKSDIEEINEKYRLKQEIDEAKEEYYKEEAEKKNSEDTKVADESLSEEEMVKFINKINQQLDGSRPEYKEQIPIEDYFLPFDTRLKDPDDVPEDFYTLDDLLHNQEIIDRFSLSDETTGDYDYSDERENREGR